MNNENTRAWHSCSITKALETLHTHCTQGLTSSEAEARLERYGPNELKEIPRPSFLARFTDQSRNVVVIILIVASLISIFLGDEMEAVTTMAIVILNATLGVIQESRAERSLAAFKKLSAPEALAIRDGRQQKVPARELVPDDIVLLETGNHVPADIRLTEAVNLRVDEAALTGESIPVEKRAEVVPNREIPLGERHNTAYMSALVTYGRGRGAVVVTGMATQIGLIAEMIQSYKEEPTPPPGDVHHSVSLAIAAVPEGLPAVVTICLALGMQRMIRRHAWLRKLPAAGTLGAATAICSDKTGTLTQKSNDRGISPHRRRIHPDQRRGILSRR
jgi:Ca2+-transporting ATPase